GAEPRLGDDLERELGHFRRRVDRATVARGHRPAIEQRRRAVDHHVGHRGDALALECRLDELALAAPEVAVAEDKPFTGDALELLEQKALAEVAMMLLQDVLDVVGMEEHEALPAREPEADLDRVSVPAPVAEHEGQRIAPQLGEKSKRWAVPRARTRFARRP